MKGDNNVPWHAHACCNVRRVGGLGWGALGAYMLQCQTCGGVGVGANNVPWHA